MTKASVSGHLFAGSGADMSGRVFIRQLARGRTRLYDLPSKGHEADTSAAQIRITRQAAARLSDHLQIAAMESWT